MSSLTSMIETALAKAKKIDAYLESQNIPHTSFQTDTLSNLPEELQKDRNDVVDIAIELKQLASGPSASMFDLCSLWTQALPIDIITKYGMPQVVSENGSTYSEISSAVGLSEFQTRRFVQAAMASHVFAEDPDTGKVIHTAGSRALVKVPGLVEFMRLSLGEFIPAACSLKDSWEKWGDDPPEQSQAPWNAWMRSDDTLFQWLGKQPEHAASFGRAMGFFSSTSVFDVKYLSTAFKTAGLSTIESPSDQPVVFVDVAGGHGHISMHLARDHADWKFIIQDLKHVAAEGNTHVPEDLKGRVTFVEHDMFTPQPEQPVHFYFFRFTLHDWPDGYSVQIFKNLVPNMKRQTKLLLSEALLGEVDRTTRAGMFRHQLDMMVAMAVNGRERSRFEFEELLRQADERFKMESVVTPEGSGFSLIVVGWTG